MADSTTDLTVEILRQIRDQLATTDQRVEKLGTRVETLGTQQAEANELIKVLVGSHSKLNEKVDATNSRLDRLVEETVKGSHPRRGSVARPG